MAEIIHTSEPEILDEEFVFYRGTKNYDARALPNFPTPLLPDDRGLVDDDAAIELAVRTMRLPEQWEDFDVHHVYWPEDEYVREDPSREELISMSFRQLPINRLLLPRSLHDWLHVITEPPPKPSLEVMEHQIEAWNVAVRLYISSKNIRKQRNIYEQRKREFPEADEKEQINRELLLSELHRRLTGEHEGMRLFRSIPVEYRPVERPYKNAVLEFVGGLVTGKRARKVELPLIPDRLAA